ncbi:vacuolar protein sorting-associated protein 26C [Scaptodrosophila lebanonensis]|uniref:Vacuolar protein sorting-associated protein 26C n=1 Tax=Drosophila lebanonensis TaxID=7225 RepID=A0A6J2UFV4_DROLE|nr:vacuolar protein sorting-associated protein 26C [Scaptodrosophila lebanonensis]
MHGECKMSAINFEIKLKRENKVYYENDMLMGCVQFQCPAEAKHEGLVLYLEGIVNLQLSSKTVGLFDTFYNSVKPITLLQSSLELSAPGKLAAGRSEFHFELPLVCKSEPRVLYETYHGVFININYQLRCDVKRNFLGKSLQKVQQFCIQYKPTPLSDESSRAIPFSLSPETLQKNAASPKERLSMPRFLITGRLDCSECCVTKPITGTLMVQQTEAAIKSIEMQLVRVETCGCDEGFSKESTEIQTIQIADGNVMPKLELPIYMVLPRLFTCPTLITKNFKIEFELNLVVLFKEEYVVSENFKIVLKRASSPLQQTKKPGADRIS